MKTKKISKWDAAPKSIRMMLSTINALCDGRTSDGFHCEEVDELERPLVSGLEDVLDDYNKLEAKHQLDCGLISDYAEENARLKRKNEKASNNIRDLRRVLEENDIATYLNPVTVSWGVANVALQKKTEHFNTQLDNLRERLREDEKSKEKWIARYHNMSDICSRDEDDSEMLQAILRKDGYTIEYDGDIDDETIRCQGSFDLCKETTQDEVLYQYGRWTLRRPLNFTEAKANSDAAVLRNKLEEQRARTDAFSKTNNDLRKRILDLRSQLDDNGIASYWSTSSEKNILDFSKHDVSARDSIADILKEKNDNYKEENKDLKNSLDKDGKFGKYVGKRIADSIREGCNKGVCKLHPLTRIDIHVEEIKDVPITFAHYAIPRISVIFNNTQTEMERDTAQHECEELNRKIKELERENKSLRRTVRFLDEGGSYEFYSCPVARECENFKPKVHHSYDPLDDLPDVEHS